MGSAALALAMANSFLGGAYEEALHARVASLDLRHWINDGLMTFFFRLVGLEIKREMVEGELDTWPRRALPLIAAFGGMFVPAVIFMAVNFPHPENWRGWAVPTATDIAFALGVLALVGSRVPSSLKVFLTSLAIIDDLGAILIIAIFYASDLSIAALAVAAVLAATLYWLNRRGETRLLPYVLLGVLLWTAMLLSGIHAQPIFALTKYGLIDKIGEDNLYGNIDDALNRAREIVGAQVLPKPADAVAEVAREWK